MGCYIFLKQVFSVVIFGIAISLQIFFNINLMLSYYEEEEIKTINKLIFDKILHQKFDNLDIFEFINPSSKEHVALSTRRRIEAQ